MKITINAEQAKQLHSRLSEKALNSICGDKITKAIIRNRNALRIAHNLAMPQEGSDLYEADDEYRRRIRSVFEEFAQKDEDGKVIGNVPPDKNEEFKAAMDEVDEIYSDHLNQMKICRTTPFDVNIEMVYKKDLPKMISLEQRELLLFMIEGEQDMDPILGED